MLNKRVIDIALKYGYESPESFSKAFSRFYGVTPNVAKRSGVELRSFNRLVIKLKWEGGTVIECKIVEREKFRILVKMQAFRNESISENGNNEIPDGFCVWDVANTRQYLNVLEKTKIALEKHGIEFLKSFCQTPITIC